MGDLLLPSVTAAENDPLSRSVINFFEGFFSPRHRAFGWPLARARSSIGAESLARLRLRAAYSGILTPAFPCRSSYHTCAPALIHAVNLLLLLSRCCKAAAVSCVATGGDRGRFSSCQQQETPHCCPPKLSAGEPLSRRAKGKRNARRASVAR